MIEIEKVLVGYDHSAVDKTAQDIGPVVEGETLRVFLSDGTEILIDMFERHGPQLDIRVAHGGMRITPVASNRILIERQA